MAIQNYADIGSECPHNRLYKLTATKHFLCLDCGEQIPMKGE